VRLEGPCGRYEPGSVNGERQGEASSGTRNLEPAHCAERVRARETERVLRKFDLSREQAKAVERVSRSLVDNLLHAPIAKVTAIFERTGESAAGREA
jgi:glutamyl-tRNA reductase